MSVINVLGTDYTLSVKKYDEDPYFEDYEGYCNAHSKSIVICDLRSSEAWKAESDTAVEAAQKKNIRHEIVHAFLDESGLMHNANPSPAAWPINEEMVDWFAIQGPKIYEAWRKAGAL